MVNWLVSVHQNFNLTPSALFLAVNIFDRYLSKCQVSRLELQLCGLASLFIAAKHEQVQMPKVKQFVLTTDGAFVDSQLIQMEI